MCLSTVYRVNGSQKTLLCKNIASVRRKEDGYLFTDIMGIAHSFAGKIETIDLMDNEIILHESSAEEPV